MRCHEDSGRVVKNVKIGSFKVVKCNLGSWRLWFHGSAKRGLTHKLPRKFTTACVHFMSLCVENCWFKTFISEIPGVNPYLYYMVSILCLNLKSLCVLLWFTNTIKLYCLTTIMNYLRTCEPRFSVTCITFYIKTMQHLLNCHIADCLALSVLLAVFY